MRKNLLSKICLTVCITLLFGIMSSAFTVTPIKSLKLNKSELSLNIGKTYSLVVTVTPSNASKTTLKWSSDNQKVAVVDKNGNVSALKKGTAYIAVKTADGKIFAKCKVIVDDKVSEIQFPYRGSKVTLTFSYSIDAFKPAFDVSKPIIKELQKRLGNIKINTVCNSDQEKMKVMLSTGDLPFDLFEFWDGQNFALTYGSAGTILELSQFKSVMPNVEKISQRYPNFKLGRTSDGKYYGLGLSTNFDEDVFFPHMAWVFNKYYLDKTGKNIPKTPDELYEYCKAVKKVNPNIYPLMMTYDAYRDIFLKMYGTSWSSYYNWNTKKFEIGILANPKQVKKAISMLNKFYKEELIPKDYMSLSSEQINNMMYKYDGFAAAPWSPFGFTTEEKDIKKIKTEHAEYDLIQSLPVTEEGVPISLTPMSYEGDPAWFGGFVNPKTKNPKLVCAVMDYLLSPEIRELASWGIEGKTFNWVNGERQFLPEIKTPANPKGTIPMEDYGLNQDPGVKPFALFTGYPPGGNWTFLVRFTEFNKQRVKILNDQYKKQPDERKRKVDTNLLALSQEEKDKVASVMTPFETYIKEELAKFVVGVRDMSTFDAFINEVKGKYKLQEIVEIWNSKPLPPAPVNKSVIIDPKK